MKRLLPLAFGLLFVACLLAILLQAYTPVPATEAAPRPVPLLLEACGTYTSTDVPKAIPDTGRNTQSTLTLAQSGRITAITVTLTISHSYPTDLVLALCAPDQKKCLLTEHGLTSSDGSYTVRFSDSATADLPASAPYTDTYKATESLTNMRGRLARGRWTLAAYDGWGGDSGQITSWNLNLCTNTGQTPAPTPSRTPTRGVEIYHYTGVWPGCFDAPTYYTPMPPGVIPASTSSSNVKSWELHICNMSAGTQSCTLSGSAYADQDSTAPWVLNVNYAWSRYTDADANMTADISYIATPVAGGSCNGSIYTPISEASISHTTNITIPKVRYDIASDSRCGIWNEGWYEQSAKAGTSCTATGSLSINCTLSATATPSPGYCETRCARGLTDWAWWWMW